MNAEDVTPYEGSKYRADQWTDVFFEIEYSIYQAIQQSDHRLTNDQAEAAFKTLVRSLRRGEPAVPAEPMPPPIYVPGEEVAFLTAMIRQSWAALFADGRTVASGDLIGILRTLLFSMEAQAWDRGAD